MGKVPYGLCSEIGLQILQVQKNHFFDAIKLLTELHNSRLTMSPAILYLVTTKSSAIVFSFSSLSAMSVIEGKSPPQLHSQLARTNSNRRTDQSGSRIEVQATASLFARRLQQKPETGVGQSAQRLFEVT